jgi:hypothetical protein
VIRKEVLEGDKAIDATKKVWLVLFIAQAANKLAKFLKPN